MSEHDFGSAGLWRTDGHTTTAHTELA